MDLHFETPGKLLIECLRPKHKEQPLYPHNGNWQMREWLLKVLFLFFFVSLPPLKLPIKMFYCFKWKRKKKKEKKKVWNVSYFVFMKKFYFFFRSKHNQRCKRREKCKTRKVPKIVNDQSVLPRLAFSIQRSQSHCRLWMRFFLSLFLSHRMNIDKTSTKQCLLNIDWNCCWQVNERPNRQQIYVLASGNGPESQLVASYYR